MNFHLKSCLFVNLENQFVKFNIIFTWELLEIIQKYVGDYEKSLEYHQKALITQENLESTHLECATSYRSIYEMYKGMKDYSNDHVYHAKPSKIYPDAVLLYHNMTKLCL